MNRRRRLLVAALLAVAAAAPSVAVASRAPGAADGYRTVTEPLGPLQQNPRIAYGVPNTLVGRDNSTSFGYRGSSYWFFGDTFYYSVPSGVVSAAMNSGSVTPDLDASNGIALPSNSVFALDPVGNPAPAIPLTSVEQRFQAKHAAADCGGSADGYCGSQYAVWPGSVVLDAPRHRALIFFTKICRFGKVGCQTGFTGTVLGGGIAVFDLKRNTIRRITIRHPERIVVPEGRDPTLLWGPGDGYGGSAFVQGRFVYTLHRCDVYFRCGLARAPLTQIDDRRRWQFLSRVTGGAPRWSRFDRGTAAVVRSGAAGGTIQWVPAMKAWLDIYAVPYANDIVWQVAKQPWGPWSPPQTLYTMQAPVQTTVNDYAAFAHPEYATHGGLVQYVTYYHTGTGELELLQAAFCTSSAAVCTAATPTGAAAGALPGAGAGDENRTRTVSLGS